MAFGDSWHPAFLAMTGDATRLLYGRPRVIAIELDSDFGSCLGQKDAPMAWVGAPPSLPKPGLFLLPRFPITGVLAGWLADL